MNLVFDIDETITKETEFMIKFAPSYLMKKYNLNVQIKNLNGADLGEVFGLKDIFINNGLTIDESLVKSKKITDSFWNSHFLKYMFYPIKEDAPKIINDLKKQGYKINFISLRGKKGKENETFKEKIIRTKIVPMLTKMQLAINGVKYDKLFLVEKNEDKIPIINGLNAKIIFDDNVGVLENVKNSIPVCINAQHNCLTKLKNQNIIRSNFDIISIKNIIDTHISKSNMIKNDSIDKKNKTKKIQNLKTYQKVTTEGFYKCVRICGKHYVLKKFKPLVIGKENLPTSKGPDVFVGNHRNIKDPLITVAILDNPVHFAALKRMFEYNENMFGKVGKNFGTLVTTLFVKSMGALPIARPNDIDYMRTNFQTFKYMSDYLLKNSAVAIYPEGTLNRNPEIDGDILELKSNHSFKLAENGKGVVRPVAMVWLPDDSNIENRVVTAFLKPIYTDGLKASEISERWKLSMEEAINSINIIINELNQIKSEGYTIEEKEKVKILSEKIKHL